jgi:predicted acetyltransferase
MIFDLQFVKVEELTETQRVALAKLDAECFGDVPKAEVVENFIAEPFAYLFATVKNELISRVALFKREIIFDNQPVLVGGMGGVCVTKLYRHHGVASSMLKRALVVLRSEKCDVGCLNVDLDKKIYGIYEKLGFTMMSREISFENISGEIIHELGTMFIPICSEEKYNLIRQSTSTFHYGKGYW